MPLFRRSPRLPDVLRATPGALPADGALELAGVALEGHRVAAERAGGGSAGPVAWRTVGTVGTTEWSQLAAAFPETGLWPVLLGSFGDAGPDAGDALTDAMVPDTPPDLDAVGASDVLAGFWAEATAGDADGPAVHGLEPFGAAFPGLAPAAPPRLGKVDLAGIDLAPLALVPVARPADVLAAIGWTGPVNHVQDVWQLSVVLRSWEDRFGVVPVVLGFDTLELAVRRPVGALDAVAVAAEFFAFCPDAVWQGAETLRALAAGLVNARRWPFWWD